MIKKIVISAYLHVTTGNVSHPACLQAESSLRKNQVLHRHVFMYRMDHDSKINESIFLMSCTFHLCCVWFSPQNINSLKNHIACDLVMESHSFLKSGNSFKILITWACATRNFDSSSKRQLLWVRVCVCVCMCVCTCLYLWQVCALTPRKTLYC
jgi:hypothetical protein